MVDSELPDVLQEQCQSGLSGCISVGATHIEESGNIYLQGGNVVHADLGSHNGLFAFFSMLTWSQPSIEWYQGTGAPLISFNESIDALLFQFAQLEDNGQLDEVSLKQLFAKEGESEVKLSELKNYQVSFEVLNTDFKGFQFVLQQPTSLVGRYEDCDIILPDGSVSGHHCTITMEPNCLIVADLGSTNGTFINDQIVSREILQVGDTFVIGSVQVSMNLKLQRNLQMPSEPLAESSAELPEDVMQSAQLQTTVKLDTNAVADRIKKRGPIKGPITWKNIDSDSTATPKQKSLWGRMFSRKKE